MTTPYTDSRLAARLALRDYQPATFTLMGDGTVFQGWQDPTQTWNGWAVPLFNRDEALHALAYVCSQGHADGLEQRWSTSGPDLLLHTGDDIERIQSIRVPGVDADVYAVGGMAWCWVAQPA